MLSRAHYLMGRIYEHFDRKEDALKEFELTINLGPVAGGELEAARQGKARLAQP